MSVEREMARESAEKWKNFRKTKAQRKREEEDPEYRKKTKKLYERCGRCHG
jgi:hypothetical protein